MKTYRIACIPGDGIGKEVIPAGERVLAALAAADGSFRFDFEHFPWGGDHYRAHIVSAQFRGMSRLQQHQLVYRALGSKMGGELHALALTTSPPE